MVKYLKLQSEVAYADLLESINDLDEHGSWARFSPLEGDYLHSDGSILGQITHVAGCKVLYASAAFRGFETRLRKITERTIAIGSDWEAAKTYLEECHTYWMGSWSDLDDNSLDNLAATNWGDQWPIWRIISALIGHDHYHAGQITLTRSVSPRTETPPPPLSEEEIDFLKTFKAW